MRLVSGSGDMTLSELVAHLHWEHDQTAESLLGYVIERTDDDTRLGEVREHLAELHTHLHNPHTGEVESLAHEHKGD